MGTKKSKSSKNQVLKPEVKNYLRFLELNDHLLKVLKFEEITEKILRKNAERFELVPPDSKRIEQTLSQSMFQKWFEDYCIIVITSFNPNLGKKGGFSSAGGCGWVMITEKVSKRVCVRKYYRSNMDNFVNNLANEAEIFVKMLQARPTVKGTKLLYKLEQTFTKIFWVNPLDETDTKDFYPGGLEDHLIKHFYKQDYSINYYQGTVRQRKGIVSRSQDNRKTWEKKEQLA